MARSAILALAAVLAAGSVGLAGAQTTTTTTTTTTGATTTRSSTSGAAGEHSVPGETSVLGQPTVTPSPAGTATGPATGTGSTVNTLGTVTMPPATMPPATTPSATAPSTMPPARAAAVPGTGGLDVTDPILTQGGVRYACTGVGLDAREDPRWRDFSAKLMFTVEGGGYLPDVTTRIADGQGNPILSVQCDGPWLLVDLPPDRYSVQASAQDPAGQLHQHEATLSVGSRGQSEEIIRFPEMPR